MFICASAKTKKANVGILSQVMDLIQLHPGLSVAEVLSQRPETAKAFIRLRTACVGCYLDQFCTLEEAAASYSLDLKSLLEELEDSVQQTKPLIQGD